MPLLVLEDMHWADQATLDVLRVLGRRIDSTPALALATYRDDEVGSGHPLRVVLGELASTPAVMRLSVPRLSLDAVRELAGPYGVDAEAIHRLTDGNAFYVTEVLAAGSRAAAGHGEGRRARTGSAPPRRRHGGYSRPCPSCRGGSSSLCWRRLRRPSSRRLARASKPACCERRATESPSDTSSPGSLSRARSHPIGAGHCTPTIVRALLPSGDFSRLAHHAEEAGDSAAVLEFAPEAARRAAEASAHREAAAQYARALRHGDRLVAVGAGRAPGRLRT